MSSIFFNEVGNDMMKFFLNFHHNDEKQITKDLMISSQWKDKKFIEVIKKYNTKYLLKNGKVNSWDKVT